MKLRLWASGGFAFGSSETTTGAVSRLVPPSRPAQDMCAMCQRFAVCARTPPRAHLLPRSTTCCWVRLGRSCGSKALPTGRATCTATHASRVRCELLALGGGHAFVCGAVLCCVAALPTLRDGCSPLRVLLSLVWVLQAS